MAAVMGRQRVGLGYNINSDNRIMPLSVIADTVIATALNAEVDSLEIDVPATSTEVVTVQLPATPNGGLITYEVEESETYPWTVSATKSLNSTDGTNGTWVSIPVTDLWRIPTAEHLQKIDIPAETEPCWIKVSFVNFDVLERPLRNLGLRKLSADGNNDYWVIFGASIMAGGVYYYGMNAKAKTQYSTDPIVFNRAYPGRNIAQLLTDLPAFLIDHPHSRFFFMHIGGNNVSPNRPYSLQPAQQIADLITDFSDLVDNLISTNRVPIVTNLTFRDYKNDVVGLEGYGCYKGGFQEYGSLPYNENVIEPIVRDKTPKFYDFVNNRSIIDFYTHVLNDQTHLTVDGVHFSYSGRDFLQQHIVDTAMRIVYINTNPVPVIRDTYNTPYQDAEAYVVIAETTQLQADIDAAQVWIDKLDEWIYNYDEDDKAILEARLAAITPLSIKEFMIDLGSPSSQAVGNWNHLVTTTSPTPLISLSDIIDTTGTASTIDIAVTKEFRGVDLSGGITAFDLPELAMTDCFYHRKRAGGTTQEAELTLSGLNLLKEYDIYLYSNQIDVGYDRVMEIDIGGVIKTVNGRGNINKIVDYLDVTVSPGGEIVMKFDTTDNYCYLNVIKLVEKS